MGDTRDAPADGRQRSTQPIRLTDETVEGKRRSALWVQVTITAAQAVDRALASLGLSRPVLVVSGFWRSGTTWVQECLAESLAAKTVFEPLSPLEPRRRAALADTPASEDALQAFVPGPGQDPAFWAFLEAATHARLGSRFSLSCRRTVRESLRTGIVMKDVRLHRNLQAIHERLDVPVLHVRRHPCAVVASLRAANWHWSFERVSLLDWPLPQVDPATISEFNADALSRLAAFWALHEREAAAALRHQRWACEVTYEDLVEAPRQTISDICRRLELRMVRSATSDQPSASIDPAAFADVAARRPDFWKKTLTAAEIERVEHVASRIYPEWKAHWPALAGASGTKLRWEGPVRAGPS